MSAIVQFQCPSCQAPLRLQNRALFVGRSFDCPDCHESLLIEADGLAGVKAKVLPPTRKPTRSVSEGASVSAIGVPSLTRRVSLEASARVTDQGVSLQPSSSAWDRLSRRPAALGWIVAALFAVILLIVVRPGRSRGRSESVPPITADSQSTGDTSENKSQPSQADKLKSKAAAEPDSTIPEADATKAVAKLELPPLPEPVAVVEPPRDDKPVPVAEKPSVEEPKPAVPPAPTVLSPEAVEAKLRQRIVRFDQPKPVPFIKVLDTVEELAGVSIVWDLEHVDDAQLQKPVTLQLKQTTVGEILDTLLKQVRLERRTVDGRIELYPRVEAVPRP